MRFVSPASAPDRANVAHGARMMEGWGLKVEIGDHVFDRNGHFLAGRDEDRLADFNDALRDRGVRAIFTTRGGKAAYRIAHALEASERRRTEPGFRCAQQYFCTLSDDMIVLRVAAVHDRRCGRCHSC